MAGAVRPLVLPLPEVEAETMGWTKRNNPWPLRAAVTRANVKGILVCGNIGRRGSSGWRRPPHSGAGSGTSPRDSRLHVHLISPCTHKMCSDCVCSPSLRFRYSTHGDSSCCLRAAPRRPRQARRFARARAPAPRSARVGGSRRRTQAGCRALWCFSFSSVAGRRPCLAPSLWSSLRAGRALASAHRDRRCARDARGARASRVVLAAAVEHGRRACGGLFFSLGRQLQTSYIFLQTSLFGFGTCKQVFFWCRQVIIFDIENNLFTHQKRLAYTKKKRVSKFKKKLAYTRTGSVQLVLRWVTTLEPWVLNIFVSPHA